MSLKILCECNQGRRPCTCTSERQIAQFSALREAMENAAARMNPCQLIVGDIHVSVSYHGIKWVHTQLSADNPPLPLTIEEFDEILASALGGKQ